jgi:2-polyprenyl-3-methyl-5-hydroxy-6-metoxy-1,4-benzoquinol methylase
VGCAYGFLLDEARKFKKCDTYGIELSEYSYRYAKERLGLDVVNSEINQTIFKNNLFDVVFLIGTIEHLSSPRTMIAQINRILKNEGLIVLTTIDTSGVLPFYSFKPPEHLFYFNRKNIHLFMNEMGFKKIICKAYFNNYFLYDIFHRLKEFSSLGLFEIISKKIKNILPFFSIIIPTNEMILIFKKYKRV